MYEYFLGQVTDVTPGYVVIEVSGIGYKVLTANPYRYQVGPTAVKEYPLALKLPFRPSRTSSR